MNEELATRITSLIALTELIARQSGIDVYSDRLWLISYWLQRGNTKCILGLIAAANTDACQLDIVGAVNSFPVLAQVYYIRWQAHLPDAGRSDTTAELMRRKSNFDNLSSALAALAESYLKQELADLVASKLASH